MEALSVVAVGGSALAILAWLGRSFLRILHDDLVVRSGSGSDLEHERILRLEGEVQLLKAKVELLPQTWEEFRDGARRAEERARNHARAAARRAAQEPDDVEEPSGAGDEDEGGSGAQRMLALHGSVGDHRAVQQAPVTDLFQRAFQLKYGR